MSHSNNWADVLKNEANGRFLIWRNPKEDFNDNSTLIVMPGEEAIFVNGGEIEEVFKEGSYQLSTQNYPFLSRFKNIFTGGKSPFSCVVYFVRKADSQEIQWGTMCPIQFWDDTFGNLEIKAFGAYKVHIEDSALFLRKLLGNNVNVETQNGLNSYFGNEFQMHIVNCMSSALDELKAPNTVIFETVRNTVTIANKIKPHIAEILYSYGLGLDSFSVASCKVTSPDPEIQKMITDRARMQYLGNKWGQQQKVDILKNISVNPGAAGLASVGAALGLGVSAAKTMSNSLNFEPQENDAVERLKKLKTLFENGLLSQEEFNKKKDEIISAI